ncbi:hypothetical protein [Angustibacter sp. Root456]|nr:hypothetical protein [Angustibacter sp. Root456]
MTALSHGVPVTLVMDLLSSEGPDSREILQSEPPPPEQWWAPGNGSSNS